MDIDFGDLDGPSKAPATKPAKFAPKNSKFKPVAKPKPEPEALVPSSELNPATVPKVELEDLKPPPPMPSAVATVYSKTEIEQPSHTVPPSHDPNGNVELDTDATEMEVDNDQQQDEDDRVVREIDVFFNSSTDANSKLYVLQYPLRQRWRPYELEDRCDKVRLKPATAEVEVEMSVQVDSENFDRDKEMKKQVLSNSWKPPVANGYAVGILMGNELHLNPVNAVVQLRPSMQPFEPKHLLKKMKGTCAEADMSDSEDLKDEKTIKQPKKQSKLPGAVNEQNEASKEEEWIPLKYHGEASRLSLKCIENMVVAREASPIQFSMSQSDYIDSLCPATSVKPKGPPVSAWLKLPLEERYMKKLREGPPVRFNVLKHIAPDSSVEDMLKVLQNLAQLVQGFWILKSKLKYNTDTGKEVCLRNYAMLQFSKNLIFHEKQLPKSTSSSETMKAILVEFAAKRDSCRDWKFREPADESFIKEYPHIVEEQKKIWDRAEPHIVVSVFPPKSTKPESGNRRPIINNNKNDNVETKTAIVLPSKGAMLDETREALPKALQKLFQAYKVCSLNQIRQRLRDMAVSENTFRKGTREARAAAAAADASQEELLKTLTQVAVNIHGVFVSRSSPDHPEYDNFRKIVIDLLLAEGPKGRLKRGSIEAAAEMQLKKKPSDTVFKKVLTEICVTQNSAWVLKSGDGSPT